MQHPHKETIEQLVNFYNLGEFSRVIKKANFLSEQYPRAFFIWNILGASFAQIGSMDEAVQAYKKAILIKPDSALAYSNLGAALKEKGSLDDAIEAHKKSIKLNPIDSDNYYNLGITLKEQGKLDKAIEAYKKSISFKPNYAEAFNNMGIAFKEQGEVKEAINAFNNALSIKPNYADAHFNIGVTLREYGKFDEAIEAFKNSISFKPNYAEAFNNLGMAFKQQGKLDEAIKSYKKCISFLPNYAEAYSNMGNALKEQGRFDEAIDAFKNSIKIKPNYAEAFNNMGIIFKHQGKLDEAIKLYKTCISFLPNYAEAYSNMGNALKEQGKFDEAIKAHKKSIILKPNYAEGYNNLGIIYMKRNKYDEAIELYKKSIKLKPNYAEAYSNMGNALREQGKFDEALKVLKKSIIHKPNYIKAYINIGNTLNDQCIFDQAIIAYKKAILIDPNYAEAYNNIGVTLREQYRLEEAINSFKKAISLKPQYAEAYGNLGNIFNDQGKLDKGIGEYNRALSIEPNCEVIRAQKLHLLGHICDWQGIKEESKYLSSLGTNQQCISPFSVIALEDSPKRHRIRSEIYAKTKNSQNPVIFPKVLINKKPKQIKIGYFSSDFNEHPVAYLIAKVIETHNRNEFKVFGYSLHTNSQNKMRQRLMNSFDSFLDIHDMSDKDKVFRAREDKLDIAIDLTGYTENNCSKIFSYRVAPVQINYLGYPGTLGSNHINYIIADQFLIPPENQKYFSEKQIYLPNTYMPTDNTREISKRYITKKYYDLPEDSFVFCCFNNNYKITSEEFDIWMRLLSKVKNSILWLRKFTKLSEDNFKKEAIKRNINPARLFFAEKIDIKDHLARYKLADLFIDTFNFNGHTTACEALWSGLPVITKVGKGFPARVAASLLNAIDLPELITKNKKDYETLIFELATNPSKLAKIRKKLMDNRLSKPLFNTEQYTKHLETGYKKAHYNHMNGNVPRNIIV